MRSKLQRFVIAVLAGIIFNVAFTFFIRIACWGPLISVILAAYLAGVSTPKDGALTGEIVFMPSSSVIIIQTMNRMNTVSEIGLPLTIVAGFIGFSVGSLLGGLFGLVVGKFFEMEKDHIVFL